MRPVIGRSPDVCCRANGSHRKGCPEGGNRP